MAAVDRAALALRVRAQLAEYIDQLDNRTKNPELYHLVCSYTSSGTTYPQLRQLVTQHLTCILFADFERLGAPWTYGAHPALTFETKLWHMYVGYPTLVQTYPCPPFIRAFVQSACDDLVVWLTSGQSGVKWKPMVGATEEEYFDQWVQIYAPASLLTSAVVNQAWQLGFDIRRGNSVESAAAAVAAAAAAAPGPAVAADDPDSPMIQVALLESLRTEAKRKQKEEAKRKQIEVDLQLVKALDRTPFPSPSPDSSPSREAYYDTSLISFVDALVGPWSVDPALGSTFEGCTLEIDDGLHSGTIVSRLTRASGQVGAALSADFAKWEESDVVMFSSTRGQARSGHSESLKVTFDTSTGGDRLELVVGDATVTLQCSRPAGSAMAELYE